MHADHPGTDGRHYEIFALPNSLNSFCASAREHIARISAWLAAASLARGDLTRSRTARAGESRHPDARPHHVHETGHEQSDTHRGSCIAADHSGCDVELHYTIRAEARWLTESKSSSRSSNEGRPVCRARTPSRDRLKQLAQGAGLHLPPRTGFRCALNDRFVERGPGHYRLGIRLLEPATW
jgi:hypothetical protein